MTNTDSGSDVQNDVVPANAPAHTNRYIYFYIPAHSEENTPPDPHSPPGVLFRLGAYSEIEENASASQENMSGFYPAQHIADETQAGILQKSSGPNGAESRGITLACDGRILVRSAERIYIHATDQIHLHSNDNIKLVANDGPIDNRTGDKFTVKSGKKISLRSGVDTNDTYQPASENSSGSKGIEIISDEGKSDVFIEGKSLYLKVNGTSTADITETNSTIMRADNFEDIWGDNLTIFRGTNVGFYFGVGFTYTASASLNIYTALDIDIKLFDVGVTAFECTTTGKEIKAWLSKTKAAAVETETVATRARSDAVSVRNTATEADSGVVTASMGNVKSLIAFWESKIASTSQI
ncbi:hypothetical protein GCM10011316_05440 [Roseibium aquae]|uniref:Uncharacterized protein n=1 Tax=Roseibium aquae TaxID=1323746 RepID=A0A916WWU9_9HYPH|nr:hypothetical protein [Roseibium aquae]GGB36190.1 hypothetical protein GCM10011316_05440 [Roseibium aquae]